MIEIRGSLSYARWIRVTIHRSNSKHSVGLYMTDQRKARNSIGNP